MNIHGTDGVSLTVALPEEARDLYRHLHRMPKPARQFAFNIIEILKLDTVNGPRMGDHDIQDPKRFLREQLERFEEAMKAGG